MNIKKILLSFFLFLPILFVFVVKVSAQSGEIQRPFFGLIINPPIIEYKANPGDTIKGTISITNDNQSQPNIVLYPIISDFVADETNPGSPKWIEYKDDKEVRVDSTMKDWINVPTKVFNFQKTGEKKDFDFEIKVPKDAIAGTHQAGIIISENSPDKNFSNAVGIVSRIATLIFVDVNGTGTNTLNKQLNLLSFYVTDIDGNTPFLNIFEYLPVIVNYDVENVGNGNVAPAGDVFLNPTSETDSVSIIPINEEGTRVLRGSRRTFSGDWSDSFLVVKKNTLPNEANFFEKLFNQYYLEVNWGKPFRLGKYTLQGKISYLNTNGEAITKEDTVNIWVFPWKILLLIVILVLIIVGLRKIFHKRNKLLKRDKAGGYDEKYTKYIDN